MSKSGSEESVAKSGATLRQRAEAIAQASPTNLAAMSPQDVQRLVFELQVHQLELELQNEELRNTQALLEVSRDRFADLYNFSPMGYLCLDSAGLIYEANLSVSSMLAVDRERLIGSKFSSFVAPEYQDVSYLYWQEVFASSHRQICELELRSSDGTTIAVRMESIKIGSMDTPAPQCRVAIVDISDVKQAKESLKALNFSLQDRVTAQVGELKLSATAMAKLGEGVLITTDHTDWPNSEIVFANEAMCHMVGYTMEELLGQTPQILLRDSFDSVWQQILKEELLARTIYSGERSYYRKDGSRRDIELVITPIFNTAQHCTHFVAVQRDITLRKRAEQTLNDREERLRAILNTVPNVVVTIDLNGIVQDCNPAMFHVFGYSSEDVVGKNVSILMPAPFCDEHDSYLRRYQETGQARIIGSKRQLTARHCDGHTFPVTLTVSEVDHLGLYLGVIQDDTDVRKLQREVLRTAGETRWRIGQALHDGPQQILAGLGLQARSWALDMERGGSPHATDVKNLSDQLQRANNDIRRLSRGLVPVRVSSGSFMSALEYLAKTTCEKYAASCEFYCLDEVHVDDDFTADQLYHIAQEAVANAVKHSGADRISINLELRERAIALRVTDNGKGIDKSQLMDAGLGLQIMPYRAASIGAEFSVSKREEGGTEVSCLLSYVTDR